MTQPECRCRQTFAWCRATRSTPKQCGPHQDTVFQCLGVGGKGDGRRSTFVSEATAVLIAAMKQTGCKRLVCMSNVGAGDSEGWGPRYYQELIVPVFLRWLRPIIDDKNRMEPLVRESGLAWVLLRFPNIVEGAPSGRFHLSPCSLKRGRVQPWVEAQVCQKPE